MRNQSRIGVLMGGLSSEKSVSMETGEAVLHTLRERGHDALPIYVDRDLDLAIRQAGIDIAFIALHGRYGEDGCVQGMLETLGIPYTGSSVLASALAMNKVKAKEIFRLHNLPTPPYYVMDAEDEADILARHGDFGFPVVVKPVNEGSSVGVAIVNNPDELVQACERAFCFDDQVLIERHIAGVEISVGILGDVALGAVEIEPAHGFYDYSAKYMARTTRYHVPPRVSEERYRGVLRQALRAHRALACSGATRVDMIVSHTGNEYLLEVNTSPGLTPTSLLPKIAHAAGMGFDELVEGILDEAVHAGERRARGRVARLVDLPGERAARVDSLSDRH